MSMYWKKYYMNKLISLEDIFLTLYTYRSIKLLEDFISVDKVVVLFEKCFNMLFSSIFHSPLFQSIFYQYYEGNEAALKRIGGKVGEKTIEFLNFNCMK